ncbi:hypothetical protein QYF36_024868 [Acer negundo]|nr:hypothetical protein QYF36_024868 [Acer negundo]
MKVKPSNSDHNKGSSLSSVFLGSLSESEVILLVSIRGRFIGGVMEYEEIARLCASMSLMDKEVVKGEVKPLFGVWMKASGPERAPITIRTSQWQHSKAFRGKRRVEVVCSEAIEGGRLKLKQCRIEKSIEEIAKVTHNVNEIEGLVYISTSDGAEALNEDKASTVQPGK